MRKAFGRGWWAAAAAARLTVAGCSSGASTIESAKPAAGTLTTAPGKALTIFRGQQLAATNGVTPVAFGKPAHGSIAYGAYGAMIYTPDADFAGTDNLPVTVSHAVRLFAENVWAIRKAIGHEPAGLALQQPVGDR